MEVVSSNESVEDAPLAHNLSSKPILVNPLTHPDYAIAKANPIYLAGDSHCIPAAWQTVTVAGSERLLVPKLVTGLKHWHLRPDSDFYPKANFNNIMKSIPDGAEVL